MLDRSLRRQFASFVATGLAAACVHYGLLIGLVELGGIGPVPATLGGYLAGGIASYALNRRLTFASDRPHSEATWRFMTVAGVGFCLTWVCMETLTRGLAWPYLPSQVVTTGLVLFWSFGANRIWTFREPPIPLA